MRAILVPLLLLLVAAAGWFLLADKGAAAPPGPPVGGGATSAAASASTVAADAGSVDPAAHPAVVREATTDTGTTANEAPPLPDDANWLELTVVDGESKAPAADVDVWWTNGQHWQLLQNLPAREQAELSRDPDAKARRFGWHARSDERGQVRVTKEKGWVSVIARDEHRYGTAQFHDRAEVPAGGYLLELFVDRSLSVHVTDAAGSAAEGVPVAIAQFDAADGREPQFQGNNRQTDAHGLVHFPHVQQLAKLQRGSRAGEPVATLAVAVRDRVLRKLRQMGKWSEVGDAADADAAPDASDGEQLLLALDAAAVQGVAAIGERAGRRDQRTVRSRVPRRPGKRHMGGPHTRSLN